MTTEVTACLVAVRRTVPDDRCTASIEMPRCLEQRQAVRRRVRLGSGTARPVSASSARDDRAALDAEGAIEKIDDMSLVGFRHQDRYPLALEV